MPDDFVDPIEQTEKQLAWEAKSQQWTATRNLVNYPMAMNASAMAREYPSGSPDMVAAASFSGIAFDDPTLHELMLADAEEEGLMSRAIGRVTRFASGAMFDMFDAGVARLPRTALRMFQGESLGDAYTNSGQTSAANYRMNQRAGNDVSLYGTSGLLAGRGTDDPLEYEGSSEILSGYMKAGMDPETAKDTTRQYMGEQASAISFDTSRRVANSSMLHKTKDGKTTAYHATPGRMIWQPITEYIRPETMPYQMITGTTDAALQGLVDPNNPVFFKLNRIAKARRTAIASERSMSSGAVHAEKVAGMGGVAVDDAKFAYHGTDVEGLSSITKGGLTDDAADAARYGERTYLFDPDELPASVKTVYDDGNRVETILDGSEATKAFPEYTDPNMLVDRARDYAKADPAKALTDLGTELGGPTGQGSFANVVDDLLTDVMNGVERSADEWDFTTMKDLRAFVDDTMDNADEVLAAIDRLEASYLLRETDDIFSDAAKLTNTPEQNAMAEKIRLLADKNEIAFIDIADDAVTPMAEYSKAEMDQMEQWGFVFPDRANYQHYADYLKETSEMGAVKSRGEWLVHPRTWERWMKQRSGGQKFVRWASSPDIDYMRLKPILKGMDDMDIMRIGDSTNPAEVEKILEGWYGTARSQYGVPSPRAYFGSRVMASVRKGSAHKGAGSEASVISRNSGKMSAYGRRQLSQMGQNNLDPYDIDSMYDTTMAWGDLLNTPMDEVNAAFRGVVDDSLELIDPRTGMPASPRYKAEKLADRMFGWMKKDLIEKGHTPKYADDIINEWRAGVAKNQQYADNAIAQPLELRQATGRRLTRAPGDQSRQAFIDEFNKLQDDVHGAEKVSDPADWTAAERAAYDSGDTRKFSELRGYTEDEIAQFERYQEFTKGVDAEDVQMPNGSIDAESLADIKLGERTVLDLDGGDALLDSQMGSRNVFMPSVREVRRATAKIRKTTEGLRLYKGRSAVGIGTSGTQKVVDGMISAWRNLALLRIGWMMRVIPDELARFYAYGYSDLASNPLSTIFMSTGDRGNILNSLDNADSLHALMNQDGLGASNGMFHGLDDQPYLETSARGSSWNPSPAHIPNSTRLTDKGAKGVARRFLQLNQSDLARVVTDQVTIDDAMAYLRSAEGQPLMRRIMQQANERGTLYAAAAGDDKTLRTVLEAIEAQRHQFTGGSWVGKNRNGRWVDQFGDEVQTYDGFTRDEMITELFENRGVKGVQGGRPTGSTESLRSQLIESDGNPYDLLSRKEAYIVTRQGDPELLELMRHGKTQGVPEVGVARSRAARSLFAESTNTSGSRSDYVWVVGDTKNFDARAASHAYRDLDGASAGLKPGQSIYVIDKESLPPSVFIDGKGSKVRFDLPEARSGHPAGIVDEYSYERVQGGAQERMLTAEHEWIKDDMTKADLQDFEGKLTGAYTDEYPPVREVSVPDKPYLNAADESKLIDNLFQAIGKEPTLFATRRPFATLRTWELMAEHWVHANPKVRAEILAMAGEADMGPRFTRFVESALKDRGWTAPRAIEGAFTKDEIVNMSWMQAADDTKELFYDLTKGGAWQDGARLVFPFADAWWEILSRWSGLMNPVRTGGQPLKLFRRGTQAYYGAESSGFFDTNDQGERVFSFPGAGSLFNALNPGAATSFDPQIKLSQLTFVDFGDPTAAGRPGFAPQVQAAAGAVRGKLFDGNMLPQSWKKHYDQLFFGDFSPPETFEPYDTAALFLPTWLRRTISRVYEGEFDEKYAKLQVQLINVQANSISEDVARDEDAANYIVKQAEEVASWMGTVDIVTSFISPAQPRNVVQLVQLDGQGSEVVKSIGALATEFALWREYYGQEQAVQYFRQMYGVDPLKLAPATWASQKAPATSPAFNFLMEHQDIEENLGMTMMAWLPLDDGEFDIDAYRRQKNKGWRENLSGKEAINYMGHVAGSHRLGELKIQKEYLLEQAAARYGGETDNDGYRYIRDEIVGPWYRDATMDVDLQYWAYEPGEGVTGLTNRPSYKKVINELKQAATPGTNAFNSAAGANPQVHEFVKYAMSQWNEVGELSKMLGHDHEWWQSSESETTGGKLLRDAVAGNLNAYIQQMRDPLAKERAEWIAASILTPVLQGFDWENPIVIAPTAPSDELLGYADQLNER